MEEERQGEKKVRQGGELERDNRANKQGVVQKGADKGLRHPPTQACIPTCMCKTHLHTYMSCRRK